jgi:hypothetical protein
MKRVMSSESIMSFGWCNVVKRWDYLEWELVREYASDEVGQIAYESNCCEKSSAIRVSIVPSNQLARKGRARPSTDCRRAFSMS